MHEEDEKHLKMIQGMGNMHGVVVIVFDVVQDEGGHRAMHRWDIMLMVLTSMCQSNSRLSCGVGAMH